jgi:arsenate reductase
MAEGLINKYFPKIKAYSAGSNPSGKVNKNAKKVLIQEGAWKNEYHSKSIEEALKYGPFDLVISVCENAAKNCPTLPGAKTLHIPFEDPDGKGYEEFVKTKEEIKKRLFNELRKHFQA